MVTSGGKIRKQHFKKIVSFIFLSPRLASYNCKYYNILYISPNLNAWCNESTQTICVLLLWIVLYHFFVFRSKEQNCLDTSFTQKKLEDEAVSRSFECHVLSDQQGEPFSFKCFLTSAQAPPWV